jgi:hypothetical protein
MLNLVNEDMTEKSLGGIENRYQQAKSFKLARAKN